MNTYEIYKEELESKKTNSSKKAYLTRNRKQVEEHLNDLLTSKFGWLHGERVTPLRIARVKTELKVINNIYKSLCE